MAEVTTGDSVGRRLNELQNALDIPAQAVSPRPNDSDGSSPVGETLSDAHEEMDVDSGGHQLAGLGLTAVPLDAAASASYSTEGRTTPTNNPASTLSLDSAASHATPTSSPRHPNNLTLEPLAIAISPEPIPNEDRYSVSTTMSTPDVDRFSTVALKTPTTASTSDQMYFTNGGPSLPGLDLMRNGAMSKLNDDEEDLGTLGSVAYDHQQQQQSENDLRIRTELAEEREESLRTPVAGSSGRGTTAATSPLSPGGSTSTKPLSEGVDLLLARLDKDKADPEMSRRSMEGREKVKETFERLHVSPTTASFPHSPSRKIGGATNGVEEKIDWGMFLDANRLLVLLIHCHRRFLGRGHCE